jgi:hypothetical protein
MGIITFLAMNCGDVTSIIIGSCVTWAITFGFVLFYVYVLLPPEKIDAQCIILIEI